MPSPATLVGPAILLWLLSPAGQAQPPNEVTRESRMVVRVERVEPLTRIVIFRDQGGVAQSVYVDPAVTAFDTLKAGDTVTVRYLESVIVEVRPDATPGAVRDTTRAAREAGNEPIDQQLKIVVTVESIDPKGPFVTYRTHDNRRLVRAVMDKRLLEGIKPGDRIEVTLTRARAISIEPGL